MRKPASVAVLPFPLTAAALFSCGILRFLGYINEHTHIRFTRISSQHTPLFGCEDRIVYLNCKELYLKMLEVVRSDGLLKKILTFAAFGNCKQTKVVHSRLVSTLTKVNTNTSRQALSSVSIFTKTLHDKNGNIWQSTEALDAFVGMLESLEVQPLTIKYPPGTLPIRLPKYKELYGRPPTDADIITHFNVELPLGRIFDLQGKNISIVVGGPRGSGKSTLAVSLATKIKKSIESLMLEPGFSDLNVSAEFVNLDLATPTAQAIAEGWGEDRERLLKLKQPYTMALAEEAQRDLLCSRAKYNITIGDLPGGHIDSITELLARSADAGIFLTHDWEFKKQWCPFMASSGLPIVSRIRSYREDEEGFLSLITSQKSGQSLSGRIKALNRNKKSDDIFITWLANFLLFEILPTQFDYGS